MATPAHAPAPLSPRGARSTLVAGTTPETFSSTLVSMPSSTPSSAGGSVAGGGSRSSLSRIHPGRDPYSPPVMPMRDSFSRATAPMVVSSPANEALVLLSLQVAIEVHLSTAFVRVEGVWRQDSETPCPGVFMLPTSPRTTVTSALVRLGEQTVFTRVLSAAQLARALDSQEQPPAGRRSNAAASPPHDPFTFKMPIPLIRPGETVSVLASYVEETVFLNGEHVLNIPLILGLPADALPSCLSIHVTIGAFGFYHTWRSESHPLDALSESAELSTLALARGAPLADQSFHLSYKLWAEELRGVLLVEDAPPGHADPRSSFVLYLPPPAQRPVAARLPRNIVFLVDRSASMTGSPMVQAREALLFALDLLAPTDSFTVFAYDNTITPLAVALLDATPENVDRGRAFVASIVPSGLTNILHPVQEALRLLSNRSGLSIVFLLTDGSVPNEREICRLVARAESPARIVTIGIGPYCNTYFLKTLATLGRGFHEHIADQSSLALTLSRVFAAVSSPLLFNITLRHSLEDCDIYPLPVPDLFAGRPLLLHGKCVGPPPAQMELVGTSADTSTVRLRFKAERSPTTPVARLVCRQYLDCLTAAAWLSADSALPVQIAAIAVAESMPCAHATLVALGPVLPSEASGGLERPGAIVPLSACSRQFGDEAATSGNLPVSALMQGIVQVGRHSLPVAVEETVCCVWAERCCDGSECGGGAWVCSQWAAGLLEWVCVGSGGMGACNDWTVCHGVCQWAECCNCWEETY